jgi:hypothetical protein
VAKNISCTILPDLESGVFDPVLEPLAGFEISSTERRTAYPSFGVQADLSQFFDVLYESIKIYPDIHHLSFIG